jgi:SAM-dependent methyltransferase
MPNVAGVAYIPMSDIPMSELSSKSFFDTWDTYQKVVAGDYMFHREIGLELKLILQTHFAGRPFSILDLGCGDAATLAPLLAEMALQQYKGVDLSETALTLAADKLHSLPCRVELMHGDILAALAEDAVYDAVHSSFALHHLPTAQKAEFFHLAAQRLKKNGLLLLADVMREEDEELDVYYQRYCSWLRAHFTALSSDEKDLICDHIVKNDFPEPCSILEAQARAAGLSRTVYSARHGWHRLMCFTSV